MCNVECTYVRLILDWNVFVYITKYKHGDNYQTIEFSCYNYGSRAHKNNLCSPKYYIIIYNKITCLHTETFKRKNIYTVNSIPEIVSYIFVLFHRKLCRITDITLPEAASPNFLCVLSCSFCCRLESLPFKPKHVHTHTPTQSLTPREWPGMPRPPFLKHSVSEVSANSLSLSHLAAP